MTLPIPDPSIISSTFNSLVTFSQNGVAHLQLSLDDPLNLVSSHRAKQITEALNQLAKNPELRVLVIRGFGEKTFVGGANIKEMAQLNNVTARAFIRSLFDLCEAVRLFPVPTIARIPSWCLGVGLELAAACDLRLASESAQFAMPEVKIGIPSVIHAALLSRLIGEGNARWLVLTGESIDAHKAEKWGLLNEVVAKDQLDSCVERHTKWIAECSPTGMRAQKQLLKSWDSPRLTVEMEHSIATFGQTFESGEPQRDMQHFLQRKKSS